MYTVAPFAFAAIAAENTDGTGADYENFVSFFYVCAAHAMVADAERLDCCKCLSVHSLTVIHTLDRHCDVLLKSTVSLTSHCLVVHTCVYDSVLAGIAVSAVEVRVAGYDHFPA